MRKLLVVSALLLTGCVTSQAQTTQALIQKHAQAEHAAWQEVAALSKEQCKGGKEEIAPEDAMAFMACYKKLIQEKVLPVAMYSNLTQALVIENEKLALAYKRGEIKSYEEARIKSDELMNNYVAAYDQRAAEQYSAALQMDSYNQQRRGQALMAFGAQMNQIQQQQQRAYQQQLINEASSPRITNCNETITGVSCTTW